MSVPRKTYKQWLALCAAACSLAGLRAQDVREHTCSSTWLGLHQDSDGKWSAASFMKHDPKTDRCDGAGDPERDLRVTGLALLAFLGDGSTLRKGPYKSHIKKAVIWIKDHWQKTPLSKKPANKAFVTDHAIATWAIVEAHGLSQYKILKRYAQAAIDELMQARNVDGGWGYKPGDRKSELIPTAWALLAMRAAEDFKLGVASDAVDDAISVIDKHDKAAAKLREAGKATREQRREAVARAALSLLARISRGHKPASHAELHALADQILAGRSRVTKGKIDLHATFFGSLALKRVGGQHWKAWRKSVLNKVIKAQRKTTSARGSWDPSPNWRPRGGRVESTALAILSCDILYNYSALVR